MVHQWTDVFGVLDAVGVEVDDFVEGGETTVVHVRSGEGDVAQRGCFEVALKGGVKAVVLE